MEKNENHLLYSVIFHQWCKDAAVENLPGGCEAEVCMSHMDPVSGTDIDLFIEGMIPCSLHLEDQAEAERNTHKKKFEPNTAK